MAPSVQHLVESFIRLTEEEQREAATEILRLSLQFEPPPLDEEPFDRIADETFLMYDADEAADGKG